MPEQFKRPNPWMMMLLLMMMMKNCVRRLSWVRIAEE
jgi:hypothetical protein